MDWEGLVFLSSALGKSPFLSSTLDFSPALKSLPFRFRVVWRAISKFRRSLQQLVDDCEVDLG
eukprot:6186093-Pleurochrysis_carterae.AAC.1